MASMNLLSILFCYILLVGEKQTSKAHIGCVSHFYEDNCRAYCSDFCFHHIFIFNQTEKKWICYNHECDVIGEINEGICTCYAVTMDLFNTADTAEIYIGETDADNEEDCNKDCSNTNYRYFSLNKELVYKTDNVETVTSVPECSDENYCTCKLVGFIIK